MKEHPILFNGAMVRALLDGSKMQTRRVVKAKPSDECPKEMWPHALKDVVEWRQQEGRWFGLMGWRSLAYADCPYGQVGDRLWVRESFWGCDMPGYGDQPCVVYEDEWHGKEYHAAEVRPYARRFGHIPGIHMPRNASRILLEVTGVRVERVQAITEADAIAEGVESPDAEREDRDWSICQRCGGTRLYDHHSLSGTTFDMDCMKCDTHAKRYRHLWDSLNEARGFGWDTNPWVWVVEFKRIEVAA